MASAEGIKVAVERAIHDALRESIQRIADQHGVVVDQVSVCWERRGTISEAPRHVVVEVIASTRSFHL